MPEEGPGQAEQNHFPYPLAALSGGTPPQGKARQARPPFHPAPAPSQSRAAAEAAGERRTRPQPYRCAARSPLPGRPRGPGCRFMGGGSGSSEAPPPAAQPRGAVRPQPQLRCRLGFAAPAAWRATRRACPGCCRCCTVRCRPPGRGPPAGPPGSAPRRVLRPAGAVRCPDCRRRTAASSSRPGRRAAPRAP